MRGFCLSAKRNKRRNKRESTVEINSIDFSRGDLIYNVLT
jgi:hypothetical protein